MTAKPARRWFSFSLRSLLVVITLVCCWLAWESSVVRGRKRLMTEMESQPGVRFMTAEYYMLFVHYDASISPPAHVSLLRRWLGDKAIQEIEYLRTYHNLKPEELARLARTFPEAKLREAEPLMEPCHPGCFPRGTLVDTPQGRRRIETIAAGDPITAFLPSGQQVAASVQSVFITDNRLWLISTEEGDLLTTETQPLCLATDRAAAAGELQPGDAILRCDSGQMHAARVLAVAQTDRTERVFNLILGDNQLFVAGGFLARSKPPAGSQ